MLTACSHTVFFLIVNLQAPKFLGPKITQFKTEKPSVQHSPQFNTRKPSVQQQKALSSRHPSVQKTLQFNTKKALPKKYHQKPKVTFWCGTERCVELEGVLK